MHVVLLILKIIGIVLLSLLGLLLFLLLLILFVPIRYQLKGDLHEKIPIVHAKVSFLFPFIWVKAGYEESLYGEVRLLGIKILDLIHKKESSERKNKKRKKENKPKDESKTNGIEVDEELASNTSDLIQDKTIETIESQSNNKESGLTKEHEELVYQYIEKKEKENIPFSEKVAIFYKKIVSFFLGIKDKLIEIRDHTEQVIEKLNESVNNASKTLDFLQSEDAINAFLIAKKTIFKLLKSIRPRKIKIFVHVGMNDPSTTGQICAIYGFLYPFVSKCVMIEPDFEQTILEGDLFLKGYLTGFMFLRVAWVALFHKDLKCIRAMVRKRR